MAEEIVTDVVEDEELGFGTEIGGIADAGRLEVCLGLAGDVARIAAVVFLGDRIEDIADEREGRDGGKRIHLGGGRIGNDDHVGGVDRLPAADGRTVKALTFFKDVFAEFAHGDGKMLPDTDKVHELEIDHQCAVFLGKFYYLFRCHRKSPFRVN